MIKRKKHFIILLYALFSNVYSQANENIQELGAQEYFIENKGQIKDLKFKPNPAVLYLLNTPGLNVQLKRNGFSYDLYENVFNEKDPDSIWIFNEPLINPIDKFHQSSPSITTHYHRIDITFVGSNPNSLIIPSGIQPDYFNYYQSSLPEQGIVNVRQYSKITYKEIYPGIDLVFYIDRNKGCKYNFLLHPSAHLEDIQFKIDGPTLISCTGKTLRFSTRFGDVEEIIPQSYYLQNGFENNIDVTFQKTDDKTYGFSLNSYIPSNINMVIDPTPKRLWGTYYGGSSWDSGSDCVVDEYGNSYLTGNTQSTNNIASAGSYQENFAGIRDGFIVKFDPSGNRVWGSYFGGNNDDAIWDCIMDKSGNIYLTGFTNSTSGIGTIGTHQNTLGGGYDGFLTKFSHDGFRIWGTYYGGDKEDKSLAIASDNNFIYIVGYALSDTGIATDGSYQQFLFNSSKDAFLAKFDSNGSRILGTYFGGESSDEAHSCSVDGYGSIYISGVTSSTLNISSTGAFQGSYGGGNSDGFLAKFNTIGERIWSTYYGGSQDEQIEGCSCDSNYGVYVTGVTSSTNGIASPGCFQPTYEGSNDAMIVKFDTSGQRIWGTYYGGSETDVGEDCVVGSDTVIFITGYTYSQNNIATPGAYKSVFSGNADGFITKFRTNGQRMWGTYYGGSSTTSLHKSYYVRDDTLYTTGQTGSQDSISSSGSWQPVYGGATDGFFVKFLDCWPIVTAGPIAGPVFVCKPINGVNYSVSALAHAINYVWTIPPGFTIITGAGTSGITVDVSNLAVSGFITVKGFNKCGDAGDSASLFISVNPAPVPVISGPNNTCAGPGKIYTTDPGKTNYQWSVSAGGVITAGGTATDNTVTVTWNIPGIEHVYLNYTDAGCSADTPTDYPVQVNPSPEASITITPTLNNVCQGTPVTFNSTFSNEGLNPIFQWQVNGIDSGINFSSFSYTPSNNDLIRCILTSSVTGCIMNNPDTSNVVTMFVDPGVPVSVSISPSQNPVCAGTSVTFIAIPSGGGTLPSYQWKVNGNYVGINSTNYSYVPVNGDIVSCVLTSNATCPTGNPATSNLVTMTVNPILAVTISINPSSNPFCAGGSVTFQAIYNNEGLTPQFQWKVNGINSGINSNTFTYNPLNNDQVYCILTSSEQCTSNNPASSIIITMIENTNLPAGVSIGASSNPFCPGSSVTFLAIPSNGGVPVYLWKVNGNNVGTNSNTYTYNPLDGDSIRCIMTSNLACVTGNPASSNKIIMSGTLAPVVTFSACFDTITTLNAKPIKLKGGIPLGGTYSGSGVSAGYYYPNIAGPGTHVITYSYTNIALCTDSKNSRIHQFASSPVNCGSPITDIRDSKIYQTVQIGTQCWLATNLNFGNTIASTQDQRDNCVNEKYCFNDNPSNCTNHGGLYQWDELMRFDETPAQQGFCPPAWHIPTENDWNTLFATFINNGFAGSPLKYSGYSGFNALLSGARHINRGWDFQGFATFFWSSTPLGNTKAWAHGLNDPDPSVSVYPASRVNAFSVRCLKD